MKKVGEIYIIEIELFVSKFYFTNVNTSRLKENI